MTDIYRISFVKLLRALAEQARNDFADEVFDAESTGERPDLEPVVVEIAVEFAEDISDAIEALQARVLEHDRIVAEKDAEIARLQMDLAETEALEMQHGAVIERLRYALMTDLRKLLAEATPGPWLTGSKERDSGNIWIAGRDKTNGVFVLPYLAMTMNWPNNFEANARLIALAPQLAAALIKAEEALASIAANTCCDGCQEAALVARAALAEISALTGGNDD